MQSIIDGLDMVSGGCAQHRYCSAGNITAAFSQSQNVELEELHNGLSLSHEIEMFSRDGDSK